MWSIGATRARTLSAAMVLIVLATCATRLRERPGRIHGDAAHGEEGKFLGARRWCCLQGRGSAGARLIPGQARSAVSPLGAHHQGRMQALVKPASVP